MEITNLELLEYLDRCIRLWRKNRDTSTTERDKTLAIAYVDAFQSVRRTTFGSCLPTETGEPVVVDLYEEDFKPDA